MQKIEEINIVLYLVLCVITLGFFYFYWQYRQMQQCNVLLGTKEHSMLAWFFFSLITFGIYHFYHEYKMSQDIMELQEKYGLRVHGTEFPILCLCISIFGFFLVSDFIHQEDLNKIIRIINSDPAMYAKMRVGPHS
jgi:Na+/proline symporter